MTVQSDPTQLLRIDELEMKVAFQEQTIAELNDVITSQSERLTELERALKMLRERFLSANAADDATPQQEPPPPHY